MLNLISLNIWLTVQNTNTPLDCKCHHFPASISLSLVPLTLLPSTKALSTVNIDFSEEVCLFKKKLF